MAVGAETFFFDDWRQHQLRIKVTRIFNTYGPRMHPNDGRGGLESHHPGAARARHHRG
jgi:nucleoside-diphosphate-sugar epimerase